jgi:hypothetical protein
MKRGDKALYAALSVIFLAVCAASGFFLLGGGDPEDFTLLIISGGEVVRSVDMSATAPDEAIEIHSGDGFNILAVEDGAVRMVSADCPGGDCLRMAPVRSDGGVIVCLPHRLVVRLRRSGGLDAVTY